MIAVGISVNASTCFANRSTVSGFFLAGRQVNWIIMGASFFASNIGSDHFIGLAGSGAAEGISVGAFAFNATIILQLLVWVFFHVYIPSKVRRLEGCC
ncbi:sodium/myo-inositol cotransporter-like [Paramacrobiotus metropolitanus]|uniref:sodium/myo-inositol cotransporter-like n=1 Tax=Paramacrobiotus metropolitanus TaxID=2943436 RepID=UPI0024464DF5|nr:sodium/myo-inositol cotransporter-like [Paramacrobiotus metropolitanus]